MLDGCVINVYHYQTVLALFHVCISTHVMYTDTYLIADTICNMVIADTR